MMTQPIRDQIAAVRVLLRLGDVVQAVQGVTEVRLALRQLRVELEVVGAEADALIAELAALPAPRA